MMPKEKKSKFQPTITSSLVGNERSIVPVDIMKENIDFTHERSFLTRDFDDMPCGQPLIENETETFDTPSFIINHNLLTPTPSTSQHVRAFPAPQAVHVSPQPTALPQSAAMPVAGPSGTQTTHPFPPPSLQSVCVVPSYLAPIPVAGPSNAPNNPMITPAPSAVVQAFDGEAYVEKLAVGYRKNTRKLRVQRKVEIFITSELRNLFTTNFMKRITMNHFKKMEAFHEDFWQILSNQACSFYITSKKIRTGEIMYSYIINHA